MKRKIFRVFWILLILGGLGISLAWLFVPDFSLMVGRRYRMYFEGNTYPVTYLQATPFGDSIFLSWENPNDSRFDHTEIYYSPDGVPDRDDYREAQGKPERAGKDLNGENIGEPEQGNDSGSGTIKLQTLDKKASYMWFKPPSGASHKNAFFTAYTVDGNGQYSDRVIDRIDHGDHTFTDNSVNSPLPNGIFTYWYEFKDVFFNLPYFILENDQLKCWFANGTLFAIENKTSNLRPEYNPFGPIYSFTNSMDTWEVVAPEVSYPVFSLPADMFAGSSDSTWMETRRDSNSVSFTRYRTTEGAFARMTYTLDSTRLKVSLQPLNDSKYNVRFNTFGNPNFKAVTHWEASQIRGSIEEDGKEEAQITAAETHAPDQSYQHQDKVFNDDYPYLNSRAFLLMGPQTEFHLYHGAQELYVLREIRGTEDFLYKNCSGEENFTFGMRWPYENHVTTIDQEFSFVVDVVY